MEFKRFVTILLGSLITLFSLSEFSFGLDENGCLFCHQYPGMVRLEPSTRASDKLKILHIDEELFYKSVHGDLSCKECHTTIKSVPHTGFSKVDCMNSCHQSRKEKKMIRKYPLKNFHKKEQSYIISLEDNSSCAVCHKLYPHSANNIVRSFLNMHTGFMRCEACHLNKTKFKDALFEWETSESVKFSGKPFGTYFNPKTKQSKINQNTISRITIFSQKNKKKMSLSNTSDARKAKTFMDNEKTISLDDRKKAFTLFHKDIKKKEISMACNECHSTNGLLDFKKLGFDKIKDRNLRTINLKGLVTKYKTFYFPNLFDN